MKKKVLIIVSVIVVILLSIVLWLCFSREKEESDALKFKSEYESLNGKLNSSSLEHRSVEIDKENPFVYSSAKEIVKKIENKDTFFVYFGSSTCPWCRSVIETAIKSAKEKDVKTIYYVDIWGSDHEEILRDTYKLDENGVPVLDKEGAKEYPILLEYFKDLLNDYTLSKDGVSVSVGEKRIFAPNFIYVEKGEAKVLEEGTSSLQTDARGELTSDILKEQKEKFDTFFSNKSDVCSLDGAC